MQPATKPLSSLAVMHTTIYDVYLRLWVLHELDVATATANKLSVKGYCSRRRMNSDKLRHMLKRETSSRDAECTSDKDREYIQKKMEENGNTWEDLDDSIEQVRDQMYHTFLLSGQL